MRHEFSKKTKREALSRSEQKCEASSALYGFPLGGSNENRCNSPLAKGVQFDHFILASEGGAASLENCRAVCLKCHSWKTRNIDTPKAAKIKRVRDKHLGIKRVKQKIQSRGFQSYPSNTKQLQDDGP